MKQTRKSAKNTTADEKTFEGFAVLTKIAEMPEPDRAMVPRTRRSLRMNYVCPLTIGSGECHETSR